MSFSSAILHNDGQGLSTMYIIQAWDVFVVHLLCAFNIVPRSFPVRPGASFPVSRGFKIPTWRRNLPSIHGYTTSSELRQQKYVTWGLLRWRATAQSSGFESWYTQSNFTLLNSVILRKISPIPNLFLVFFFCGTKCLTGGSNRFCELEHLSRFPHAPMVGSDRVSECIDLAAWRSGQDVGESWWQELASLCILLSKDFEKESRSRPKCFFFFWEDLTWACGNFLLLPMAVLCFRKLVGWSPNLESQSF